MMLALAACSSEQNEPVVKTDDATVTFSVNLSDIDSRVISDGTTADQLIFAVYDSNGNELTALRQNDIQIEDKHATVTTRVAHGLGYKFAFWAQKKKDDDNLNNNGYYNTTDLKDVVVSYEGYANDENRDAFTAVYSIAKVESAINKTITLSRPFAQVDYVCTIEEWENLKNATYQLLGSELLVASGAFTHYNVLTGKATQPTTAPITLALSDDYNHTQYFDFLGFVTSKVNNTYQDTFTTEDGDKFWLSMNYILATPEVTYLGPTTMNIYGFKNYEPTAIPIWSREVPIQRNHRTVITVSNLTTTAQIYIDINPNFNGDH